ncbi:KTSC domain-containing protein [Chroococcidiopsis sp. FACHB-1243]|uniref:KTSC domain-containing protein n=1 Tax=Chroococcidiopsis sp. [FACHB-1243] TaxID=2692781 RepID=UPI00178756DA|nr:KTSC domain-containing protein [Chroococcidiopsis sp. [FACHB-1243]]MBD2306850.1 KTSC domain-containing protein [Chroococcidiopsis sp. [FACHB-1243]]
MKFSKLDLGNLVAVGHSDGYLGLLIDRGNEFELVEVPAPLEACEGLQHVNSLVNTSALPAASEALKMLPVRSTIATSIGYDCNDRILQVEFSSGSVYQYADVEPETWEALQETNSLGRFYNNNIKGQYDCQRIDYIDCDYSEEECC